MGLLLAGIDEAGYGPMLGPLCVGCAAFRVHRWTPGEPAPNLWDLLKGAICREPDPRTKRPPRIAVADSKKLKLANSLTTKHPLVHLERGVLAFLRTMSDSAGENAGATPASLDDAGLFERLGARLEDRPWYDVPPVILPVGQTAGELAICGGRLAAAMEEAGVEVAALGCEAVPERLFNETVRRTRSKADATLIGIGVHLGRVLSAGVLTGDEVRVVCDRLGGRTMYQGVLSKLVPGAEVRVLEESEARSRYEIGRRSDSSSPAPRVIVQFMSEAESAHLPVALASMAAKYVRELAMMRFNRYWCARMPELKPTAGYVQDARRWLRDAASIVTPADRAAMVRVA